MEQPAPASTAPLRGALLDERYRLDQVRGEHPLADGCAATLWRALDVALDRRVAVVLVETRTKKARKAVTDAATRASRVDDGRCVRVLDVGEVQSGGVTCVWVASEWVDGPSLGALLRREPLAPGVAVTLLRECAQMLLAAERVGCRHGRLHPDEVLLAPGGVPRLTGVETAAALAGVQVSADDDVRGLGALLFAMLTGRWPVRGWTGLPRPDGGDGLHPRTVDHRIPREADEVTARALRGEYDGLDALLRALRRLPAQPLDAPAAPTSADVHRELLTRWGWRVLPPILVAVIGIGGWVIGSDLGRVPQSARARHAALPPSTAAAPGAGRNILVWRTPPALTSFDPEGDGEENPDAAGFAVDHDPSTTWTTDLYRTAHLGGLKSGVGLLIDLRHPVTVRVAELALLGSGSGVELRAGDRLPRQATDLRLLQTSSPAAANVTWTMRAPVTARYWLIWFTNLPKAKGGYRAGITEAALLGPAAG